MGMGIAFMVAIFAFIFRRMVLKRLAQRPAAAAVPPPDPEVLDLEAPPDPEVLVDRVGFPDLEAPPDPEYSQVNRNRFQRSCFWVLEVEGGFTLLYHVCCRYRVEIMVHGTVEAALRGAADLLRVEGRSISSMFLARVKGRTV